MAYLAGARASSSTARRSARAVLDSARALIVVALAYDRRDPGDRAHAPTVAFAVRGQWIARYARGDDYHIVLRDRLVALADRVAGALGRPVVSRPCVDSAPVLEREWAERGGLGFIAKNTMLIAPGAGSYVVLGELLVDADLAPTAPPPDEPARQALRQLSRRASMRARRTRSVDRLPPRRASLHLVPDDRARWLDPARAARRDRHVDLRLRYLPAGLPVQRRRRRAARRRARAALARSRAAGSDRARGARHEPDAAPRQAHGAAPDLARRLVTQCRGRDRQQRRRGRDPRARRACSAIGRAIVRGHAAWALGRYAATGTQARAAFPQPAPRPTPTTTSAPSSRPRSLSDARTRPTPRTPRPRESARR